MKLKANIDGIKIELTGEVSEIDQLLETLPYHVRNIDAAVSGAPDKYDDWEPADFGYGDEAYDFDGPVSDFDSLDDWNRDIYRDIYDGQHDAEEPWWAAHLDEVPKVDLTKSSAGSFTVNEAQHPDIEDVLYPLWEQGLIGPDTLITNLIGDTVEQGSYSPVYGFAPSYTS